MPGSPVIEAKGLSFSYGSSLVLEEVDLAIAERDFACIVGPNGGGKTTLLKLIVGLERPDSGAIRVLGTTPEEARPRIGYMPQYLSFDPRFPVTVMDVVLMGCLGAKTGIGPYGRHSRDAALAALQQVDLAGLAGKQYSDLSGGERQRALIARALSSQPELLLMDEPTSNLDLHMERELYELLSLLNEHLTVVTVTHDLGFVSPYVKTVVCVKHRVSVHPTEELTGATISELYGEGSRMVRHDRHFGEGGF